MAVSQDAVGWGLPAGYVKASHPLLQVNSFFTPSSHSSSDITMDSSVSCACQQDSNSVALNVQDLVLKLQALATSRRARRNAFPRPRGISCHRQKRQPAGRSKPTRYNDKYISKSPSNTNTEPTLPTNRGGDASQPHGDTPRFFDIDEVLDEILEGILEGILDGIPSVKVDEIDLTQCEGSEGVEKAIDSAVLVEMTPREMVSGGMEVMDILDLSIANSVMPC